MDESDAVTVPAPIGVFDSGVGGLTVLRAIWDRLPGVPTVYLGDTARVPYGTKSAEVVTRYSLRNAQFLLEQKIGLLVVACNTASAVALPSLEAQLPIPVIGVIGPGAQAAAACTRNGRIAVLGTPGTIASGAYQRSLATLVPELHVIGRSCPLFVPLAEEGWTDGEVPRLVAERYLADLRSQQIDTAVLGCTHYPLLAPVISQVLGAEVVLVDSAKATAQLVAERVGGRTHRATSDHRPSIGHRFFVTDAPQRFQAVAERFLGRAVEDAQQIDLRSNPDRPGEHLRRTEKLKPRISQG